MFPLLSRMAAEGWRGASRALRGPLRALLNNLLPRLERYARLAGPAGGAVARRRDVGRARRGCCATRPTSC